MPQVRLLHFKTREELQRSITPLFAAQGEVIPWTWFDTVTYTSGTTTQLDAFQSVPTDRTLGNMQAAGQIPAPMYFDMYHLGAFFDMPPAAVNIASATLTNVGATNDVHRLIIGAVSFLVAQKSYYEAKIAFCPGGAGARSWAALVGTYTAQASSKFDAATNGDPDIRNRNQFWGGITIPHNQNFLVRSNWTAALTLNNGNTNIVWWLDGYLYRRVL